MNETWEWVIVLAFAVIGTRAIPGSLKLWRHETTFYDEVPSWWWFSDPFWRGFVRAIPLATIGAWIMIATVLVGSLMPPSSGSIKLPDVILLVFTAGIFAVFFLMITVTLLNWPKFAVPRHLRNQPGALKEWSAAKHKKNVT